MAYITGKVIKYRGYYGHQDHNGYLINDGYFTAVDAYINALGDTTYCTWILPISDNCPVLQTMHGGPSDIRRVVSNIITLPIKFIEEYVGASFAGYVGIPIIGLQAIDVPTIPLPSAFIVSEITAKQTDTTPDTSGHYNVKIDVTTTGTGTFRVTVDGNEIHREDVTNDVNNIYTYNWGFKYKSTSYNICADVI